MAVQSSDLVSYLSANRPEDDTSTSGGAIDAAARELDKQLTSADTIDAVSDGTDSRDLTIVGRDASGSVVQETITLNGTTTVSGSQTFERILNMELSASDGSRTVTVTDGDSGDGTLHTFNPSETDAAITFQRAASESAQTIRYEKVFVRNDVGDGTSLNSASVELTADPGSNIEIAVEDAINDNGSVANRETAPGGITADGFVDDNTSVDVPGGTLGDGDAIGVWVKMTLSAGQNPSTSSYSVQVSGTST